MDYITWEQFVDVMLRIIAIVIAILSYLHRNDHNDNHHDDDKKR